MHVTGHDVKQMPSTLHISQLRSAKMEQHFKAIAGAVFTAIAWAITWIWAATAIHLEVIDQLLRICLSAAGLVTAYYTARYYKRNSERKP